MPRHCVVNAAALGILTSNIFFFLNVNAAALKDECRGIGASAKTQIFPSCLNAAASVTECCGIELSAKMNAGALVPECRGIDPCFCIPLLLHFSTLFLLIFWPEQPMNHKMKEINEK